MGDFNEIASPRDFTSNYIQNNRKKGLLHRQLEHTGFQDVMRIIDEEKTTTHTFKPIAWEKHTLD